MSLDAVGPGTATVSMTLTESMVNGHAIGHGGYTFTLADSAFAFACNSYNRSTVATGAEIRSAGRRTSATGSSPAPPSASARAGTACTTCWSPWETRWWRSSSGAARRSAARCSSDTAGPSGAPER
jgi:hypothetical protein